MSDPTTSPTTLHLLKDLLKFTLDPNVLHPTLKTAELNAAWQWGQAAAPASFTVAASPAAANLRAATRAYLLLGTNTTLRGVAELTQLTVLSQTGGAWAQMTGLTDLARLGLAIYRVATDLGFGAPSPVTDLEFSSHATVGTFLPLPVWATANAGVMTWRVDLDRFRTALGDVPAGPVDEQIMRASDPVQTLEGYAQMFVPGPKPSARVATAQQARADLRALVSNASFDAAAEGAKLATQARWNPYAVLFRFLETTVAFDAIADANARGTAADQFVTAFWNGFTGPERQLFASTSAGYAILRRLWRWWAKGFNRTNAPAPAIRTQLSLADDDLEKRSPGNVGELEPPPWGLNTYPGDVPIPKGKTYSMMAYGRQVDFMTQSYHDYHGVGFAGVTDPVSFLPPSGGLPFDDTVIRDATAASRAAKVAQWGRVLNVLARVEGMLEASSAWDSGVFSVGFQQWTAKPTEGPVLFQRIKRLSDAYYDLVIRALGVETGTWKRASGYIRFSALPAANSTITLGGTAWTFVKGNAGANQSAIGPDVPRTLNELVRLLNASTDARISKCKYGVSKTDPKGSFDRLSIEFRIANDDGNSFTLEAGKAPASNGTVSAAMLTGGAMQISAGASDPDFDTPGAFIQLFPAAKPAGLEAPELFDWKEIPKAGQLVGKRALLLCARWTVAARYSLDLWQAETELAYHRVITAAKNFDGVANANAWSAVLQLPGMPLVKNADGTTTNTPLTLRALFPTEAHMMAIVDVAINTPGFVGPTLQRAAVRALALAERSGYIPDFSAAPAIDDRMKLLVLLCVLAERQFRTVPDTNRRGTWLDTQPERTQRELPDSGELRDAAKKKSDGSDVPILQAYADMLRAMDIERDRGISLSRAALWPDPVT